MHSEPALVRCLNLKDAIAVNMVTMIGSAIFVTIPLVLTAMGGPQAFLAWIAGMLLCLADGFVWAELGVALPEAGGTYVYLAKAFGQRWGRPISFVFLWGTAIIAPLIGAYVAVSFAQYTGYFWSSMTPAQSKLLAASVCVITTILLYREVASVARLSRVIMVIVVFTLVWIVITGLWHFDSKLAFDFPPHAFQFSKAFLAGLGSATIIAALDYGGYCTVCLVAGEVDRPAFTIPRSIIYSILLLGVFYLLISMTIIGVIPWREAARSTTVVTDFFGRVHGSFVAGVSAVLILIATAGCLYTSMLGFSRVLYAGAVDGQFFARFAQLHPVKRFPSFAVVVLGGLSAALCVLDLDYLIKAISAVGALTGTIPQVIALLVIRRYRRDIALPYRMPLYPLTAAAALAGWIAVFFANDRFVLNTACAIYAAGIGLYLFRAHRSMEWPFRGAQTRASSAS
jgi:amino acid transporter